MSNSNSGAVVNSSANNDNVMAAIATIPLVGLIMFFAVKDMSPLARYYAKLSIGLTVLSLVNFVFGFFTGLPLFIGLIFTLASCVLSITVLVLWIIMLVNALQGKQIVIPVLSDLVNQYIK